jgi:signal transduction histidine kinase
MNHTDHRSQGKKPIILGQYGELVVHKTPIWNPPPGVGPHNANRSLEGYVVLALHEGQLGQMIRHLWLLQVAAAAAICLITVPVVVWGANKWTAPLRELLAATTRLAGGWEPKPIEAAADDELGVLADSFNYMAAKLYTTQKALEKSNQQLEQSNEKLERKVQLRTAELEKVNRRLESELRDKDEFLRTVTHDLSTPLRNINGMATMILKKYQPDLNDDPVNKLNRITANVKVQSELIEDLMELSRLRTRPAKQETVNLQELAEQLVWNLAYDLEQNRIELEIVNPLPKVATDRLRIRQVLQNLLDNAIKYMGNSEKRQITIGYKLTDGVPMFSVTDTGCGIDQWDLPTIFNVFRRGVYSKATKQTTGRGVGLSSVKAIIETMGGRVWVESPSGKGATFYFTLDPKCLQSSTPAAA